MCLSQLKKIGASLFIAPILLPIASAHADEGGLIKTLTGYNINEITPAPTIKLKFGGWVETGFTGNPRGPRNKSNYPVSFNDGANQFKLHQVYAYIEKEVDTSGNAWDIGMRADLLYGTDAKFSATSHFDTTILGVSPKHQLVFPQLYASLYAPIGNGLTLTAGHFYTLIGYESVMSPNNFFFSHAYTMRYAEPFTHMGMLLSYPVNSNLTVKSGMVTGWDSLSRHTPNYLGGLNYASDDKKTSFAVSLITGDARTTDLHKNHNRTMYSVVVEHRLLEKLRYVFQHDFAVEAKTASTPSAAWYGINQYLLYDISDKLGAGLRFEWFHDKNGTRVMGDGHNQDFIGITAGLNYKPITGITLRPEIRYDWATRHHVFKDGRDKDQILLSVSAILHF
ncbi:porin [Nitrosomonas sp.]|uniref:porin n=1 Tax=Nitrosomonas sp. TaxID=42353 RepID=UPI0025E373B5|nr:porin [Nitrosomonas sp.]MCC6915674.1 porin [Nitrosomonas sp.]